MLQRNSPKMAKKSPTNGDDFQSSDLALDTFGRAAEIFRRQMYLIIFVASLVPASAILFLVFTPPEYVARATLIIDAKKAPMSQQQPAAADLPLDTAFVGSQVEILRSDNIARSVIKNLNLKGNFEDLPGVSNKESAANQSTDARNEARALNEFERRLSINRIGTTYIIEIAYRSLDPERAAKISNAVAEAYIADQLDAKYEATRRATNWMQDRITELHTQVTGAETAVVTFKTKNNIVNTGGANSPLVGQQQIGELNTQLVKMRAGTAEAKARLDRIEEVINSGSVNATVADALKNDVVSKLRSQYFELAFREADWSARYGSGHLAAVNLRSQMEEVRKAIFDEFKRLAETYKSDFEIAKQREEDVQKQLATAVSLSQASDRAQISLRELESRAQSYKSLFDTFLQRYTESLQQQSFPISEARLISPATPPSRSSYPKTFTVLSTAILLGSVLGFGVGWLRDKSDRTFRTRDDVERFLSLECLALIPELTPSIGTISRGGKPQNTNLDGSAVSLFKPDGSRKIIRNDRSLIWTPVNAPLSVFSESLRSLKLAMDLGSLVKTNSAVGFTSSIPNEGKSTVAAALAQIASLSGARCVLVDCDLRNPTLSRQLAPNAGAGLIEVLAEKYSLNEVMWSDHTTNLDFLPVVVRSRLSNTSDILASKAVLQLFEKLRAQYDYVIVDLPPISPIVDVRATSHFIDSYIYLVEWGATRTDVVQFALKHAPELLGSILGVVLNKVDFTVMQKFSHKYKSYYSGTYLKRYGLS
jgi:succinoglycan biosynthesis transport protein ExoP